MFLSQHEQERLLIHVAADVAQRRRIRGLRLNYPEATAVITAFLLGQVDKYSWKDTGSSFGLSDTLAAQLFGQLEVRDQVLAKRQAVWDRYAALVAPLVEKFGLTLPVVPEGAGQAYHMFHLLLLDRQRRGEVLRALRDDGVQATFHYVPLHDSDAGRMFAAQVRLYTPAG